MSQRTKKLLLFLVMGGLLICVGLIQSWSLALAISNLCIISAVMSMGVNIQWGYAGLFNAGVMGFAALGGLSVIIISHVPVPEAWNAGGAEIFGALAIAILTTFVCILLWHFLKGYRIVVPLTIIMLIVIGYFIARGVFLPAVERIEGVEPAKTGFLGGLGLPVLLSWIVGGVIAAGAAWFVGKVSLGLRSDYLAIATLGISEIIISILKNEEWLTRGVKNVTGLPRPTPYEVDLQGSHWFQKMAEAVNIGVAELSSIFVKLCYAGLFLPVLLILLFLAERALKSPWGRMMRAIRDNEHAASAMGKNVNGRRLEVFILGSAVIGVAGAMLTTLDGQFTPTSYQPLRFTFLIWVMVIVGGSGNNFGAILGGFVVWFFWIESEPIGRWLIDGVTTWMGDSHPLRLHLIESAAYMRPIAMGVVLLLVLRFSPQGLIPEEKGQAR